MAEAVVAFIGLGCIVIAMLHFALKRAPMCVCRRADCGGGCIKRKK